MGALGIDDAIALALAQNPDLAYARGDLVRRDLNLKIQKGQFIPRFTVEPYGSESRSRDGYRSRGTGVATSMDMTLPTGGNLRTTWSVGASAGGNLALESGASSSLEFSFSQPLLRGAGLHLAKAPTRAALRRHESNRLDLQASLARTVDDVVSAYRAYAGARRSVEIHTEGLARTQGIVAADNMMMSIGMLDAEQTVQTAAGVARRELDLSNAKNEVARTRVELLTLLGADLDSEFDTTYGLDVDEDFIMAEAALAEAMRLRPDYRKMRLDLEAARDALASYRNARLWDLSFNVSSQRSRHGHSVRPLGWDGTENSVSLSLSVPFGRISHYESELDRLDADAEIRRASSAEAGLARRVRAEVTNAVRDAGVRLEHLKLARRARNLATEAALGELERLDAAKADASNFRALELEEGRIEAEITLLEATLSYLDAHATLHRATGMTLLRWAVDLGEWGVDDGSSAMAADDAG